MRFWIWALRPNDDSLRPSSRLGKGAAILRWVNGTWRAKKRSQSVEKFALFILFAGKRWALKRKTKSAFSSSFWLIFSPISILILIAYKSLRVMLFIPLKFDLVDDCYLAHCSPHLGSDDPQRPIPTIELRYEVEKKYEKRVLVSSAHAVLRVSKYFPHLTLLSS